MKTNLKISKILYFWNLNIKFLKFLNTKINFFCIKKINTAKEIFFLFVSKYLNNKLYFLFKILNKINILTKKIKINFFITSSHFQLKLWELELKGLNYWFSKYWANILLDLGQSHFQIFFHPIKHVLVFLWKKKLKRVLILSFNTQLFSSLINFFWYNLKSVGPYKLKGFQFINEWLKLKQGKKPFK